jgi:ribosomal protein S18 acetylase RimI-like enzyme
MNKINNPSLFLEWSVVPEDTVVTGCPVWKITRLEVKGGRADADMKAFETIRDQTGVGLVSSRLPHACLTESMFLEEHGFRFIEMLYQPELALVPSESSGAFVPLSIRRALDVDLPAIEEIAGKAFVNERFHMDPRLGPELGNQRYQNWVRSSFAHPDQQLYALSDGDKLVAFFVTEMQADGVCYWHLNAVAPEAQGLGYGRRAWQTMIKQAAEAGAKRIQSSVVARNHRVLNLYASLGFHFSPPSMTFHWVRSKTKWL